MRASYWLWAAVSLALIWPTLPAEPATKLASIKPEKAGTLDDAYSLAFWGILGDTNYDGIRGDSICRESNFQTGGVVNVFWQAEIDATSNGHYATPPSRPPVYDSYSRRSDEKTRRVKVTYDNARPVRLYADPPYSIDRLSGHASSRRRRSIH